MKPSLVAKSIETLVNIKRPVMIVGSPGGGKSQVVAQVGAKLALPVLDIRAILYDPVDFRGLPSVEAGFTVWSTPGFLPRDGAGILFLDELNAAPVAVQAALYRLILDRQLDGYTLPDGWAIVAAGNKSTDGAIVNRMSSALKSRLVTVQYETNLDDWRKWAVGAGIAPEIIAYLSFRPSMFDAFAPVKPGEPDEDRPQDPRTTDAFPVPRTWGFVSDILKAGPDASVEHELYAGAVGAGAAAEFMGFLKMYRTLPSPDAILMAPSTAEIPAEPATIFALATALARKATEANFANVITYAKRLRPEISVALVKQAIDRTPSLQASRPFTEWAALHSDFLA